MIQGRLELDDVPVAFCEGSFSGKFDLSSEEAEAVRYGDMVALVVYARCGSVRLFDDKNGDLRRRNIFSIEEARVALGSLRDELVEKLDLEVQPKLDLGIAQPPVAVAV